MRPFDDNVTDAEFVALLAGARTGRRAAWDAIYRGLAPQVRGFLRGRGCPDPDDVLGEVFLEVARGIDRFEGDRRGFRGWVFTIARSRMIDQQRRSARTPVVPVEPWSLEFVGGDVEDEAGANLALDDLTEVLDHLTDDQRDVVLLRVLGGFTAPEVAVILDRTVGGVEALQHRGLTTLRKLLTERSQDTP